MPTTSNQLSEEGTFTIGAVAHATDGQVGRLTRVVIDPIAKTVTHLVVEPHRQHTLGRLVPVNLAKTEHGKVELSCSKKDFEMLSPAVETEYVQSTGQRWGYSEGEYYESPYYGLAAPSSIRRFPAEGRVAVEVERIPLGEITLRRGDHVQATDGDIGHIHGLVVDPTDFHVTHFLLAEGHIFGRKDVAVPIGAVKRADGLGVRLSLSTKEVEALPPVEIQQRPRIDKS